MIRIRVCNNGKIISDPSLNKVNQYLKNKANSVWVDLEKPTDKEYDFLKKVFKFHPLAMEDCKKSIELPKIDFFDRYVLVVLHSISSGSTIDTFRNNEIDPFLGKNFLVTVHNNRLETVEQMITKLDHFTKGIKTEPDFLMYQIIDHIVDLYFPLLDKWEDKLDELEEDILNHAHPKRVLKVLNKMKKDIFRLRKSTSPQRDVINSLTKKDFPYIREKTSIYFRDIYDHIMRVFSEIETQKDMINNAFEAHLSVISTETNITSTKMNEVMQKLTIVATIFMPLTFITGIYGMNFNNMPELTWKYGYYMIVFVMFFLGVLMYLFFKKRKLV